SAERLPDSRAGGFAVHGAEPAAARDRPASGARAAAGLRLRAVLEPLQAQIQGLSAQVRAWGRTDPSVAALVATLPSLRAPSAATLLAELGDPHRFVRSRAVAAYSGFVPRVSQSADRAHPGRMTKQGNPELRWITSHWAVRLLTDDPLVRG